MATKKLFVIDDEIDLVAFVINAAESSDSNVSSTFYPFEFTRRYTCELFLFS